MTRPPGNPWRTYRSCLEFFLERPDDELLPTPGDLLFSDDSPTSSNALASGWALLNGVVVSHPGFFNAHPYEWLYESDVFRNGPRGAGPHVESLEYQIYALILLAKVHALPIWRDGSAVDPVRFDGLLVVVPQSPDMRIRIEHLPDDNRVVVIPAGAMVMAQRIARALRLTSAADASLRQAAARLAVLEIRGQHDLTGGHGARRTEFSSLLGHTILERDAANGVFAQEDFALADAIIMGALFHETIHALYGEESASFTLDEQVIAHDASADLLGMSVAPMVTEIIAARYPGLSFGRTLAGPYALLSFQIAMLIQASALGDTLTVFAINVRLSETLQRLTGWIETARAMSGHDAASPSHVAEMIRVIEHGRQLAHTIAKLPSR